MSVEAKNIVGFTLQKKNEEFSECVIDQATSIAVEWGSRNASHGPKVITAMDCHAKMFRKSYGCRKLSELFRISTFCSLEFRVRRMKLSFRYRSSLNELWIFRVLVLLAPESSM